VFQADREAFDPTDEPKCRECARSETLVTVLDGRSKEEERYLCKEEFVVIVVEQAVDMWAGRSKAEGCPHIHSPFKRICLQLDWQPRYRRVLA